MPCNAVHLASKSIDGNARARARVRAPPPEHTLTFMRMPARLHARKPARLPTHPPARPPAHGVTHIFTLLYTAKDANTEVMDAKKGKGAATLSMALFTVGHFIS